MSNYIRHPNTQCVVCSKPIYKKPVEMKKNKGNVFCSLTCFGRAIQKDTPCIICTKPIRSGLNKKTCSRACANKNRIGIKYKLNRPKDKVAYADGLKLRLLATRGSSCERCGFLKTEILIVHHQDRDRSHNDLENLELICPNCHAEEHYLEKNWLKRYNISEFKEKLILKQTHFLYNTPKGEVPESGLSSSS